MLLLSTLVHRKVVGPDGCVVGRIADMTAHTLCDAGLPLVDHVVLSRRRESSVLVPCEAINLTHVHHLQLNAKADARQVVEARPPGDDEIMLVRDVLDTQVIDIAGQRLTRVADVVLARRHDGRIELVGVEVGFDAVLRRLGLGRVVKLSGGDAIAWTDLHLMSDRGHTVQLAAPSSAIHRLDARALAALVARLRTGPAADVLAARDATLVADVIQASHPDDAERILRALALNKAADVVAAMPANHARHWRDRLSSAALPRRRHFLRSGVWPRRRRRGRW